MGWLTGGPDLSTSTSPCQYSSWACAILVLHIESHIRKTLRLWSMTLRTQISEEQTAWKGRVNEAVQLSSNSGTPYTPRSLTIVNENNTATCQELPLCIWSFGQVIFVVTSAPAYVSGRRMVGRCDQKRTATRRPILRLMTSLMPPRTDHGFISFEHPDNKRGLSAKTLLGEVNAMYWSGRSLTF